MSDPAPRSEGLDHVPVIDLGPVLAEEPGAKRNTARRIAATLEDIGFMGIANHGVPAAVVDAAFAETARFFALPAEQKLAVKINSTHRGYMPMADQHRVEATRPNLSESFIIGLDLPADDPDVLAGTPLHGPNQWPEPLPSLKPALQAYHEAMTGVGFRLLELFELALDLAPGHFQRCFGKPMSFVRALHYPPAPDDIPDDQFGAAPHSDFGFLTLLAQDAVGGLQVKTRAGAWVDVPNLPGVFVVNVADMLMRWTNDRFVSTVHRVVNAKGRDRYSLPFFFDPAFPTEVACLPSCQGPGNPPRYEPTSWGTFVTARFDAQHAYRKGAAKTA